MCGGMVLGTGCIGQPHSGQAARPSSGLAQAGPGALQVRAEQEALVKEGRPHGRRGAGQVPGPLGGNVGGQRPAGHLPAPSSTARWGHRQTSLWRL